MCGAQTNLKKMINTYVIKECACGAVACTDFLKGSGEKKGTLARVLAPKRAVYHVFTSQGGSLVCFANQEGTLACVLAPKRTLQGTFWLPRGHFSARFGSQEGTLAHVLDHKREL